MSSDAFPTFEAYARWRDEQVCQDCGKPFKGDTGAWATETECWDCFQKRCATPMKYPFTAEPSWIDEFANGTAKGSRMDLLCDVLRAAEALDKTVSGCLCKDLVKTLHDALEALKARVGP